MRKCTIRRIGSKPNADGSVGPSGTKKGRGLDRQNRQSLFSRDQERSPVRRQQRKKRRGGLNSEAWKLEKKGNAAEWTKRACGIVCNHSERRRWKCWATASKNAIDCLGDRISKGYDGSFVQCIIIIGHTAHTHSFSLSHRQSIEFCREASAIWSRSDSSSLETRMRVPEKEKKKRKRKKTATRKVGEKTWCPSSALISIRLRDR